MSTDETGRPGGQTSAIAGAHQGRGGLIATLLGLYLLLCSALTLYAMVSVWSGSLDLLHWLFPGVHLDGAELYAIQTFTYTAFGAVLGAIILCFRNLHQYAVVLRGFSPAHAGSYLIGPWAAGLLGVTVYAMLRGGLLVFGAEQSDGGETSCYAFLALGIMTGFSWERMLARIDDAARQVFGSRSYMRERPSAAEAA
jgi:hypothetical protein